MIVMHETHSKNIEICLSKLYIGTYSIVHNIIYKVHAKHRDVWRITSYVTCVSGCFGDVKAEGASLLTPFIIFSPFYKLNEKGR